MISAFPGPGQTACLDPRQKIGVAGRLGAGIPNGAATDLGDAENMRLAERMEASDSQPDSSGACPRMATGLETCLGKGLGC